MDLMTTALICAATFGVVTAVSAFIRQLMLHREKKLNDKAQRRALAKEAKQLQAMRHQLEISQRYDAHYRVLEKNSDSIRYIDEQIDDLIARKMALIERYSKVVMTQSDSILKGGFDSQQKQDCDVLRQGVDRELAQFDNEIKALQQTRADLWENHQELQDKLLEQEQAHNRQLDDVYRQHSSIIEKLSLRHAASNDIIAAKTLDEGGNAFKMMVLAPIKFLVSFFTKTDIIDLEQVGNEIGKREDVKNAQEDLDEWDGLEDEVLLSDSEYNGFRVNV